mmetsp:Transcript_18198/g.50683  ORF Transcript_18198/g.50683 Transcript_18198/m.50683 type:complete len:139 (+) Transcript_18198:2370-2786(+)
MEILEEGDCCVKFKAEVQEEVEEDFSTKSKDGVYVEEAVAVAEKDIPVKYMGEVNVEEAVTEKDCFTKSKVVIWGDHWMVPKGEACIEWQSKLAKRATGEHALCDVHFVLRFSNCNCCVPCVRFKFIIIRVRIKAGFI